MKEGEYSVINKHPVHLASYQNGDNSGNICNIIQLVCGEFHVRCVSSMSPRSSGDLVVTISVESMEILETLVNKKYL